MPGDTFSYNETIGDTTIENGYKVASVYENGKTSTGVGGGICQVSSTLYSAVLYADLKVVERRNHSLTVGYVPKGQDATVSYGSIDFKFANNTDYPIKISSAANGGTVTAVSYTHLDFVDFNGIFCVFITSTLLLSAKAATFVSSLRKSAEHIGDLSEYAPISFFLFVLVL